MDQAEGINISILLVAGIIGMLLLSIAIILFFMVYQKRLLAQQKEMLRLESDYQKSLLDSSLQTQETERKRIAVDLHDSVGSLLSATKLYIKQIKWKQEEEKFDHVKKEALGLLDETIVNIRDITQNILPPSLERFGWIAAVEDLCERHQDLGMLRVDFSYNVARRLPEEQELALYRIFQELFNNTTKHAKAEQVKIDVLSRKDMLLVNYKDNGIGFDPSLQKAAGERVGVGLKSIESRANFLRAQLQIDGNPGQGMSIRLEIPLD